MMTLKSNEILIESVGNLPYNFSFLMDIPRIKMRMTVNESELNHRVLDGLKGTITVEITMDALLVILETIKDI